MLTPQSMTRFRFLEVDSWNLQHGFDTNDSVEEKIVEEMKAVQVYVTFISSLQHPSNQNKNRFFPLNPAFASDTLSTQEAGDLRRGKMKEDFEAEDRTLSTLDAGLRALTAELESAAAEAERTTDAENGAAAGSDTAGSQSTRAPAGLDAARQPVNPYSEYRTRASQAPIGTFDVHSRFLAPFSNLGCSHSCLIPLTSPSPPRRFPSNPHSRDTHATAI